MPRFILRYSGEAAPAEHTDIAGAAPNLKVVDRTPKMMLVEGNEEDAKQLVSRLPGWTLHPEVQYRIPDTRKRIANDGNSG